MIFHDCKHCQWRGYKIKQTDKGFIHTYPLLESLPWYLNLFEEKRTFPAILLMTPTNPNAIGVGKVSCWVRMLMYISSLFHCFQLYTVLYLAGKKNCNSRKVKQRSKLHLLYRNILIFMRPRAAAITWLFKIIPVCASWPEFQWNNSTLFPAFVSLFQRLTLSIVLRRG